MTARDLLGRDGLASTGLLARICRRLPPRAPTDVRVDNEYTWSHGVSNQVLKVNWQQSVNGPETNITAYWIYRWNSATQHMSYEGNPSFNRIAMVPHRADTNRNYFVDNGQGSPVTSTNLDETFWYTVRAVDLTACGDLPSPHSGMAYGVLRDRIGPEAPTGGVNINCIQPHIDPVPALTSVPGFEAEPTTAYFGVRVRGLHPALAFAEFRTTVEATLPVLPTEVPYETVRVDFDEASDGSREAGSDYAVPYAWSRSPIRFEVRVGVSDDLVSPWITYELPSSAWPVPGRRLEIRFFGGASVSATRVTNPEAAPITLGLPRIDYTPLALPPLWSMTIPVTGMSAGWVNVQTSTDLKTWTDLPQNPIQVVRSRMLLNFSNVFGGLHHQFFRAQPTNYLAIAPCAHYPDPARPEIAAEMEFKPGTKEYRLYRRADDGPLTLLAQGQADYDIGVIRTQRLDEAWPAGARKLCYFAQAIDRHGNPSPMVQLGDCVTPLATYVPCPVLSTITPTNGPGGEPQMLLSWFCPPDGASRFRAYVATNDGTTFPFIYSRQRSAGGSTSTHRQSTTFHRDGLKERVDFTGTFELGRIGAELGAGPKFSAVLPVAAGVKYYVKLVAINSVGRRSNCEKTRTFTYRTPPPTVSGLQVPWPARSLPPVSANWTSVSAELMAPTNGLPGIDPSYPVGIRIGTAVFPAWPNYRQNAVPSLADPRIHLYPAGQPSLRDKILPAVLYRSQLSNERFPFVSHDVVQASPLIDQIAYFDRDPVLTTREVTLKDPFIRSVVEVAGFEGEDFTRLAFFLLDTQPVLAGAKYQYTLVRFDSSTREPIESIPAGTVTIPEN